MHWDTTWKYPLLLDEKNRVLAKDNSPSPEGVVKIEGKPTKEDFIRKADVFWKKLELEFRANEKI